MSTSGQRLTCFETCVCMYACVCMCSDIWYLVVTDEFLVGDVGGQVCVQQGAESQAVAPAAAEVCHINVLSRERVRESVCKRESVEVME